MELATVLAGAEQQRAKEVEEAVACHATLAFACPAMHDSRIAVASRSPLAECRTYFKVFGLCLTSGKTMASDAESIVFMKSEPLPGSTPKVQGYDFNDGIDHHKLLSSYRLSGFQATNFGKAVEEILKMLECRDTPLDKTNGDWMPESVSTNSDSQCSSDKASFYRPQTNCTIFLGYTSNMVSCGVRESIRFLVEHKMVDCIVTTAGGVEEDLIKCLAPTYLGEFSLPGRELRRKGINRIGNLLVPNQNYCLFENWVMPLLDEAVAEQKTKGIPWTPSSLISRLGKAINDPSSILYWAAVNEIPVFSPALTDGSLGDMMYFHSYKNPGLVLDILPDLRLLNTMAVRAKNTGMIIVGGGVVKHHICNANLMRNGANFSVFLNTANEFDGSDSGARPDEAISWGKIRMDAQPVKVYAEASLIFPLLVAETFARTFHEKKFSGSRRLTEVASVFNTKLVPSDCSTSNNGTQAKKAT
ncbi:unnamed protein product [Cyprideis torosa]|uniref:deoxyhypusine synthase n=1 Tax=Cyprideis torosa TaxID=163714 RepID=A0A7R8ZKR4_9CRUS|nr:unnamed protein product [Cyprideis torosa]CAG0882150.1 unnamed protein product [Cyprideis torosa]